MHISAAGLSLIKRCEGFRSAPYADPAGLMTIGYGHRIRASETLPANITEADAEEILLRDVQAAEHAVARLVHVPLTQVQFDALVDFVFNLGAGRLAESTLLKELNAGHYAEAAREFLKWTHCAGRESAGLKQRREAEFQLFSGNIAPQNV